MARSSKTMALQNVSSASPQHRLQSVPLVHRNKLIWHLKMSVAWFLVHELPYWCDEFLLEKTILQKWIGYKGMWGFVVLMIVVLEDWYIIRIYKEMGWLSLWRWERLLCLRDILTWSITWTCPTNQWSREGQVDRRRHAGDIDNLGIKLENRQEVSWKDRRLSYRVGVWDH